MTDLRTLAQADLDDDSDGHTAHVHTLEQALGLPRYSISDDRTARAILAALDAERAQGYARAMGEVVERCQEPAPIRSGSARLRMAHAAGWGNAMCHVADWAIERCE